MKKKTELFFEWCLERLPMVLLKGAVALLLAVACVQVGIWHGRNLTAGEMAWEIRANWQAIQEMKARIEKAEREIKTYETLVRVIECESGGRHDIYGDGGKSYGLLQYKKRTFDELAKKAGLKNRYWKNAGAQVELFRWAISNGYGYKWTCYDAG